MRHFFHQNIRARDHLEVFLISAVTSLLLVRLFLELSGYPQVGGDTFHIAHMLYGGLLMMAALVLAMSFIGWRILRVSALVGGVGFGVFIDELGKFITKDNNYFFRPTIGIIYALFIVLYFIFNFLSRSQHLSREEYQLNALYQFEDAVTKNLDDLEKGRLLSLLRKADASSPITQELKELLARLETIGTPKTNSLNRLFNGLNNTYKKFWRVKNTKRVVGSLFLLETFIFLGATFAPTYNALQELPQIIDPIGHYDAFVTSGQFLSSLVAAVFAVIGTFELPRSRRKAFEFFRRATLINLLLTQFFVFSRAGLGALPGFSVNLVLLLALRYAIYQEQRSLTRKSSLPKVS